MESPSDLLSSPEPLATKRRWYQFRRRSLWLFVGFCTLLGLGWLGAFYRAVLVQQQIVHRIQELGGGVSYDYQFDGDRYFLNNGPPGPPGPALLRRWLGADAFCNVTLVSLMRPSPAYTESDLRSLQKLPHLKRLLLQDCAGDQGLLRVAKIKTLERLSLFGSKFTDRGLAPLSQLPKLRAMGLSESGITTSGLAQCGIAEELQEFSMLYATDAAISRLDAMVNLESLQFARGTLTDAGLKPLAKLGKLQHLDIWECRAISDAGFAVVASLKQLESLRTSQLAITDAGVDHLFGLSHLCELDLRGCAAITDAGVKKLQSLPHLARLGLGGTKLSDAGLVSVAKLFELEYLDVSDTNVTDAGVASLASLNRLQTLKLADTKMTDAGVVRLQQLKNLKLLAVGPGISEKSVQRLLIALPNCTVEYIEPSRSVKWLPAKGG